MFFEPNRVVLDPSTCFFDARIVLLEPSKVAVYSMLSMSVQREIRVETFLRPLVAHPLLAMSQAASSETFDTPIDGPISSSSIITIIHHPSSIIRRPSPVIRHPPSVIRHPLSLHHLPPSPLPNSPCVPPHPIHRTPSQSKQWPPFRPLRQRKRIFLELFQRGNPAKVHFSGNAFWKFNSAFM